MLQQLRLMMMTRPCRRQDGPGQREAASRSSGVLAQARRRAGDGWDARGCPGVCVLSVDADPSRSTDGRGRVVWRKQAALSRMVEFMSTKTGGVILLPTRLHLQAHATGYAHRFPQGLHLR